MTAIRSRSSGSGARALSPAAVATPVIGLPDSSVIGGYGVHTEHEHGMARK
jgi:hypothetical protein